VAASALVAGCGGAAHRHAPATSRPLPRAGRHSPSPARAPHDIYAHAAADRLSRAVAHDRALVYVPNSLSDTVDVISQRTLKVITHYPVGALPQHVTPAWNLRTLYVDDDAGNSLEPIDPRTARPRGRPKAYAAPNNLYYPPDGRYAIVVAERLGRLDFRDPRTFALARSLPVPCRGVNHMDFSAAGAYAFASCEFDGSVLKIDLARQRVVARLRLRGGASSPQDVKLSPDGRVLYVADLESGGVWELDPHRFTVLGFLRTGAGAHGFVVSRSARYLYVSNRGAGSVSVVDFARRRVVRTWRLPPPASPDMGGVSADGRTLWLSGRYDGVVYAIDTRSGRLRARIPVGGGPHGLCVWPQPGRYSLGHTGTMR
jgi:YVTN family beta-propeller protein